MPHPSAPAPRPVLVAGGPRSGTTWVGTVLSLAEDACSVHEPDNPTRDPFAFRAAIGFGRRPVLGQDDEAPADYEELWSRAMAGLGHRQTPRWATAKLLLRRTPRSELDAAFDPDTPVVSPRLQAVRRMAVPRTVRPAGRQVVVKSVHGLLSLPWLADRFSPEVVIVLRHPLNVVASYAELGWHDGGHHTRIRAVQDRLGISVPNMPTDASPVARVAWQTGVFASVVTTLAERHPGWQIVTHEELCRDPQRGFRRLYADLGLTWTTAADDFLDRSNRPGTGLKTNRVSKDQPGRWRDRLIYSHVDEIRRVLALFPPLWGTEELIA